MLLRGFWLGGALGTATPVDEFRFVDDGERVVEGYRVVGPLLSNDADRLDVVAGPYSGNLAREGATIVRIGGHDRPFSDVAPAGQELGNVWSSTGDGAQAFSPAGALLLRIVLPESGANVAFGGPTGRTLFITAPTSLYAVDTLVRGAPRK